MRVWTDDRQSFECSIIHVVTKGDRIILSCTTTDRRTAAVSRIVDVKDVEIDNVDSITED